MVRLIDLLKETASPESLITQWKQTISPSELKYFCKRDNCGPAALSFMQFLTKQGVQGLKRIEGYFKADSVVYDKADFTKEMKQEFISDGGNWNNANERKQWIENSEYAEQWKFIPHYWVQDSQGNIYDAIGEEQFIKTKLAKDLNKGRYSLTDTPNVPPVLYHATYKPLLSKIKQDGLGTTKSKKAWEDSKSGLVYLATDIDVAGSYAEASEMVPDSYIDNIIVLHIDTSKLDISKLNVDKNVQDNEGDTLEYSGVIPFSAISKITKYN